MRREDLGRRDFLQMAFGLASMPVVLSCFQDAQGEVRPPNFVFLLADDQGWPGTSTPMDGTRKASQSDYYSTPNLERLAREGLRFSQGYAPAALCCPTRRAIQFGQTPARQGRDRFAETHPVDTDRPTIPRLLKRVNARYKAAHFGKWDLRTDLTPEHLGYDESDGNTGNGDGNVGTDFGKEHKWTRHSVLDDPKRIFSLTERAVDFMKRQVQNNHPFYLQISHYAVHAYMQAREETLKKYEQSARGEKHNIPAFAAMTEDLDTGLGRLLDALDELAIADNTYVIYMADNGAVPWYPPDKKNHLGDPTTVNEVSRNAPLRSGKWTVFEGGIRVPFLVRGPGVLAGEFCNTPVTGCDLLPTIADLAGYDEDLPRDLDGGSFRAALGGAGPSSVQRAFPALVFHRYSDTYGHSAIRQGRFKLVKFWQYPTFLGGAMIPDRNEEGRLFLFDLENDIGERQDLSAKIPDKTKELHAALQEYLKEVDAEFLP